MLHSRNHQGCIYEVEPELALEKSKRDIQALADESGDTDHQPLPDDPDFDGVGEHVSDGEDDGFDDAISDLLWVT